MTFKKPLSQNTEVVDTKRKWTANWYSWLSQLIDSLNAGFQGLGAAPSLTAKRGTLTITATNINTSLEFGTYLTAPYGQWIQSKDTGGASGGGSGTAFPIFINPLGGIVGLAVDAPDIGDGFPVVQIGPRWTITAPYDKTPGGVFAISGLNVYGNADHSRQGITVFTTTEGIGGSGQAGSFYAYANNALTRGAWPLYTEVHRTVTGDYGGSEFACVNRVNDTPFVNPYAATANDGSHGSVSGLQIDAGNGIPSSDYLYYGCMAAIIIVQNSGSGQDSSRVRFDSGINFQQNSLTTSNTPMRAMNMTTGMGLTWWSPNPSQASPTQNWSLYSTANSTNTHAIILTDNDFTIDSGFIFNDMTKLTNAANDAAAATAGVAVGQMYRNGSVLMVRVT